MTLPPTTSSFRVGSDAVRGTFGDW